MYSQNCVFSFGFPKLFFQCQCQSIIQQRTQINNKNPEKTPYLDTFHAVKVWFYQSEIMESTISCYYIFLRPNIHHFLGKIVSGPRFFFVCFFYKIIQVVHYEWLVKYRSMIFSLDTRFVKLAHVTLRKIP